MPDFQEKDQNHVSFYIWRFVTWGVAVEKRGKNNGGWPVDYKLLTKMNSTSQMQEENVDLALDRD